MQSQQQPLNISFEAIVKAYEDALPPPNNQSDVDRVRKMVAEQMGLDHVPNPESP